MDEKEFPCDKCGLCCKRLYLLEEMKEYDRGDGVCKYLKNNLCTIYDNRPDICNSKKYYKENYSNVLSWDEYIKKCKEGCKALQDIEKL